MSRDIVKNTAFKYLAIHLTDEQADELVAAHKEFSGYEGHPGTTLDTYDRDLLADVIAADVLGVGREWIVDYGDEPLASQIFLEEFAPAATAKGYHLIPEMWSPYTPVSDDERGVGVSEGPVTGSTSLHHSSTESLIETMKNLHKSLRDVQSAVEARFKQQLDTLLPVGTVVDISKPGPAHRADVIRGRGFGSKFRIESGLYVTLDPPRIEMSRWTAKAVSVRDDGTELGNTLTLQGRIFPSFRDIPTNKECAEIIDAAGGLQL